MTDFVNSAKPAITPPLAPDFRPASLATKSFLTSIKASRKSTPLVIGMERGDGSLSVYKTLVSSDPADALDNILYADRLIKFLLWQRGGWKIIVGGPRYIGEHIKECYSPSGTRAFDAELMGGVYDKPFTVEIVEISDVPSWREENAPLRLHLE